MTDLNEPIVYCANHPDRETGLRCHRCDKPICYQCAIKTPVGQICPECYKAAQAKYYNGTSTDVPVGAVIALVLGVDRLPSLAGRVATGGRLDLFKAAQSRDSIPPGAIGDLAAGNPGSNTMGLTWTATGDDGAILREVLKQAGDIECLVDQAKVIAGPTRSKQIVTYLLSVKE